MYKVLGKSAIIESVQVFCNAFAWEDIEESLRRCGILSVTESLLGYEEERQFVRMGGESYGAVFRVTAARVDGRSFEKKIYAKAVITGFGIEGSRQAVEQNANRLETLARWGIRTPKVYGYDDGTLYLEHVAGYEICPQYYPDVDALARVGAILDAKGARPLNFIADMIIDGQQRLHYIDAGSDLGDVADGMMPSEDRPAFRTLLAAFGPRRADECRQAYHTHYARQEAYRDRTDIGHSQA